MDSGLKKRENNSAKLDDNNELRLGFNSNGY